MNPGTTIRVVGARRPPPGRSRARRRGRDHRPGAERRRTALPAGQAPPSPIPARCWRPARGSAGCGLRRDDGRMGGRGDRRGGEPERRRRPAGTHPPTSATGRPNPRGTSPPPHACPARGSHAALSCTHGAGAADRGSPSSRARNTGGTPTSRSGDAQPSHHRARSARHFSARCFSLPRGCTLSKRPV